MPRNGDGQSGFSEESINLADHHAFRGDAGTGPQDGGQQQARKVDSGRFQWVTNDEGVANFLQRPPSRQKEAFPTHLADTVPYPAFQVCCLVLSDTTTHSTKIMVLCTVCFDARLRVVHERASQPTLNIFPLPEEETIAEVSPSQYDNSVLRDVLHIRFFSI